LNIFDRTVVAACVALTCVAPASAADYAKRAAPLDASIRDRLVGKWTNPVDLLVIDIRSVDLTTGEIRGVEWPTVATRAGSSAPGTEHDIVGWVSAAPASANFDNVVPVSLTTSLFEYGTLPVWAGYLKDGKLITMNYLVWPNRTYPWDHISAFQQTWTRTP